METEYEATFTDIDKNKIQKKLRSVNAEKIYPDFLQKRVTFNLPESIDSPDKWVRVRKESDKVTMTYKNISGTEIEDQKEVEISINNFNKGVELLESIGMQKKAYQENRRELWQTESVHITIDEWPFLAPFIEIEGKSEAAVQDVSDMLGLKWKNALFGSVTQLYTQKYDTSEDFVNNKVDRITFDMTNPFE